MKAKNLVLCLAAFVFAVGSAFASLLVPKDAFVRVKYQGQANFTCVNTTMDCSADGSNICKVNVQIDIPSSVKTVEAHTDNSCTVALSNSTTTPIGLYNPSQVIIDAQD